MNKAALIADVQQHLGVECSKAHAERVVQAIGIVGRLCDFSENVEHLSTNAAAGAAAPAPARAHSSLDDTPRA